MTFSMVRTLGVDLAAVDGNTGIDWKAVHDAGARFVFVKRTQHVYQDAQYATSTEGARAAGLVVGAYDLPGWGIRAAPAKSQIASFKNGPGQIIPGKDLPPALDIESGLKGGFAATGMSKAELVESIRQLVLEMQDQLGVAPVIYTSYNQWWDLGLPAAPWASPCPLWIKTAYRLNAREPVDQVAPADPHVGNDAVRDPRDYNRIPNTWNDWWFHQFQGDALGFPGLNKTVDVDRFHTTQRGATGPRVTWLQKRLAGVVVGAPYRTAPDEDGVFGDATDTSVRTVQASHGLVADGIVGPATFAAIAWAPK